MAKERYSVAQVWLHWIIAGLILLQYLSGEAMEHFQEKIEDGVMGVGQSDFGANMHMILGVTILALAGARLALRLGTGVPAHTKGGAQWTHKLAHYVQVGIYVLIFLLPMSGFVGYVLQAEAALNAHLALRALLIGLVGLHVAGAAYQFFILKSGSVQRMLRFK